jgi:hypothetical protein
MRAMLPICSVLAMLGVAASDPANGQQQNQTDFELLQQRADKPGAKVRKSGSIIGSDYEVKKPGSLKAKGGGKTVEEGGQNTFTHKVPSGAGKVQKKPDSLGRIKTQFPWQRRD